MRASFIHLADTHLGYEQYGVRERFNDFSRAFWDITEDAANRQVDFVIIAGDLFNKRAIDALTLIHAIEGLKKLKEKGIPVVAIEGNHDRSYYREGVSWLQFLCHQEYLMLLAPAMREGTPVLSHWNKETMLGSHVDLLNGRLRVYGCRRGRAGGRSRSRGRSCWYRVPGASDAYWSRQRCSTYSGSAHYGPVSAALSLGRLPGPGSCA